MPSDFVRTERARQQAWKSGADLPEDARAHGTYNGRVYPWLMPLAHADHTLWRPIRQPLLEHFSDQQIVWHEADSQGYGTRDRPGPSCNLMDSQISCLNFWCGLATRPESLLQAVRLVAPDAVALVAPNGGPLVEPEWKGHGNPLRERGGQRRRGSFATSADLLLAYVDARGTRHGLLVESKYSESYAARDRRYSPQGTDRLAIYQHALDAPWCPLRPDVDVAALMFEPFDQHLRQQLLAAAMAHDPATHGFHTVRLVHVAPRANRAFHTDITAPALQGCGNTVAQAWSSVLRDPTHYQSLAYEDVFRAVASDAPDPWVNYITQRYGWTP